ncbi:phasin family protein [Noviherbaspirillum humi]|uniref:Phasin family protein n=1 Tax=Noviherbaspirillum humi TaxID=1688639 RepID=A0A239GJ87_9BURK|nr:phasin family protein [Noviherbaspirillum humi]SNS68955.1 phasin family protein [Noviherbaspirillum humi]
MFSVPEQFSSATKATIEFQLATFNSLTAKAVEGFEQFVDLHLTAAKTSLEEAGVAAKQLIGAKDAQEWMSVVAAHAQPNAEKALSYGRQITAIASGIQSEFAKAAEQQISDTSRKVVEMIEEVTKHAPASEGAVELIKSVIGNASASYEQLNKTTKQAVETLEANLNSAVTQFTQPATKAKGAPKKATA